MLKKKSLKEKLDQYGSNKGIGKDWRYKKARKTLLEDIRRKTSTDRRRSIFKGAFLLLLVAAPFALGAWVLLNQKWEATTPVDQSTESHIDLFTKEFHNIEKGIQLKVEYFKRGGKAADTKYKNGRKHQNAESYYPSGEQFSSTLYFYDTLVTSVYLFKSGDTIPDFPVFSDNKVHHLAFRTTDDSKIISYDYWDGKIIPGSYGEFILTPNIKKRSCLSSFGQNLPMQLILDASITTSIPDPRLLFMLNSLLAERAPYTLLAY